jgi:hypothetical protein
MEKSAILSPDKAFRYLLVRRWDVTKPTAVVILLNPSTADATTDDATIRKLYGFAERLGWGGFSVVNLYAFRATKPAELKAAGWPVGEDTDLWIAAALRDPSVATVVCAWGANVERWPQVRRAAAVLEQVWKSGHTPMVFAWNEDKARVRKKTGGIAQPRHPLMLGYDEGVPLKAMPSRWPWNAQGVDGALMAG